MIKAAVVGASGYSGAELVKILAAHPQVEISAATSMRFAGKPLADLYPNLLGSVDLQFTAFTAGLAANDVVFLALPHGKAMEIMPELKQAGAAKIIDISGDFRLQPAAYEAWYGQAHSAATLVDQAVYGLTEINKDAISTAEIVANPGCYATAIILAAAPLAAAGLVDGPIVANCISGASGAGRALSEATQFCQVDENVSAYKVGGAHQHIPEVEQLLAQLCAKPPTLVFTPHLGPYSRGVLATLTIAADISGLTELRALYREFYDDAYFVKMLAPGAYPGVKSVAGSNFCHIGLALDERAGRVIVISAIDNLVKGAAGQAVQNMNVMFDLDETTGLTQPGMYP